MPQRIKEYPQNQIGRLSVVPIKVLLVVERAVTVVVYNAPLAHSLALSLDERHVPVINVRVLHVLEGDGRHEALRFPGLVDLGIQLVDLLERKTLGLVDHGPDEEDADEAASAPDEEDLGTQVGIARACVDHVRGGVSNTEVEEPVGGRGH